MQIRELSLVETETVQGGLVPLIGGIVVAAVVSDIVLNVIDGASDGFTDGNTTVDGPQD